MSGASEIEQQHRQWLDRVGEVVGEPLDGRAVERVLELAKRVAHGADRPLALVAAYALGVAVARGADADATARRIADLGGQD
ncbi:hypothetical protein BJF81_04930 [Ornithinimicrobium sp. CNJ-824]|uniref:DUF6457 domain-containing protein n=1 Tax=Ornithinimicrobium sp. CNJ-824 TaxID=1904966 RepID=UPI00095A1CBA|nr:DUF6457 domain-containing protein [Ornithinimicrobium sp. CNJ-824]OLT20613.1 hypothetical protein BJF81_04930 [Ornithinimicrobium sp. CNJ-824]